MSLRKYETLTPAGKRMRIARDVLAQLDAHKIVAEKGTYLLSGSGDNGEKVKVAENCRACALGSMVMCKLNYRSDYNPTFYEFKECDNLRRPMTDQLEDVFDKSQIDLIECAFEGRYYSSTDNVGINYNEGRAMWDMYSRLSMTSEDILRDIMHNIIANRGTFVVTDKLTPAPKRGKNQHNKALDATNQ